MTIGFRCRNINTNVVTVDENLKTYVYLGKYPIPDDRYTSVDIDCVGFPLIYFSIPYNVNARVGIAMTGLESIGVNKWRAFFSLKEAGNGTNLNLWLRVFGRLDLNYPNGSGIKYGILLRNLNGQVTFDSNLRMHKLAGNTYSTELTLLADCPTGNDPADKYDTNYAMPFNMANKSICANARGVVYWLEYWGSYVDWETGRTIDQYQKRAFQSYYSGYDTTIRISREYEVATYIETIFPIVNDLSNMHDVKSRIAVIDNTKFP